MIRLGMKGVAVAATPEKSITKSDLFTPSGTHDRLTELTRPACVTALEQIEAMERQRRQDWLDKISGRSATLEWVDRMKSEAFYGFGSAADAFKRAALGSMATYQVSQPPVSLSGLESSADALKRAALGSMATYQVSQPPVSLSGLESSADALKRAALGSMIAAGLATEAPGTLYGFGPAAEAFKRWEQDALSARAQRGPELAPLAPAPALRIAPQPTQEPNLVDLIAELERHQQQVLERWMAVFDRERITSGSDKEAASRAAHLIAQNEGEKPGHVWTMIRQSLALRTPDEQAAKQAISQRAADIARQKNAGPRAWVLKEWEDRPDLGQSKASFARQYVPLVKKHFDLLVTEDTIKRDWLPKSGK